MQGSGHSVAHSKIDITINAKNQQLTLVSSNQYNSSIKENNNAIGLENLKKRLSLIYPENHSLSIVKKENRYTVELKIPQL